MSSVSEVARNSFAPGSPGLSISNIAMGALAGVIATVPMTWALRFINTSADDEIVANLVRRSGYPLDADSRELAVYVSRFGFGLLAGVLYSTLAPNFKSLPPSARGPVFGIALGAITSFARNRMHPHRSSVGDRAVLLAAHLTWGFAVSRLGRMTVGEIFRDALTGAVGRGVWAQKLRTELAH